MSAPKGKTSVKKAIIEKWPMIPVGEFPGIMLVIMIMKAVGRQPYADTVFRKMRELRSEGKIDFECLNKHDSMYKKLK